MALSVEWMKNITEPKKREEFELILRNSLAMYRLKEIVDEWDDELSRKELKEADFDTPNWEVRTAFRLGDRARLRKLRDLLSFLNDKVKR